MSTAAGGDPTPAEPGAAAPGDPQAGENTCPACAGTGQVDGAPCSECGGRGVVVELAGDA